MPKKVILCVTILIFVLVGCRQQALTSDDINIALAFAPETLEVGETLVLVTVTDNDGNKIDNATVNVRGDMSHAGMIPVIVDIDSASDGLYEAVFEWTMAGDWVLGVTATLPDGVSSTETFEFTVEGDMSDMDDMDMEGTTEADMDMDNMDDMDTEATDEADMDMDDMDDMGTESTEEASGE